MTNLDEREQSVGSSGVVRELREWLAANWDPELTVREWWERLGLAGWAAPSLPVEAYGRGLSTAESLTVIREILSFGALGAPGGLGLFLAAPTIAAHGTRDQIDRYVADIVTGRRAWCQLFSEPGAGSDLAGLTTRAVSDGDLWMVNGQKVWTSLGQWADYGMLLARTDPDVPKHQGISWIVLDMHQAGVEVRPLREMTGRALFNEVFLSDARASDRDVIGGVNNGWAVANTTLTFERVSLGVGSAGTGSLALPGSVAGHLDLRAGDFVARTDVRSEGSVMTPLSTLVSLARATGRDADPVIRQGLARLHTLHEVTRLNAERLRSARAQGGDIPGLPNIAKLLMSDTMRLSRDLGLEIAGMQGTLHSYSEDLPSVLDELPNSQAVAAVTSMALHAQAPSIYGGTDQIQRNIIGERVLGLPKEANQDRTLAFSQLPRNG
jgi:alkylation response protein AidB-like acyl-CoA dehydrogenase